MVATEGGYITRKLGTVGQVCFGCGSTSQSVSFSPATLSSGSAHRLRQRRCRWDRHRRLDEVIAGNVDSPSSPPRGARHHLAVPSALQTILCFPTSLWSISKGTPLLRVSHHPCRILLFRFPPILASVPLVFYDSSYDFYRLRSSIRRARLIYSLEIGLPLRSRTWQSNLSFSTCRCLSQSLQSLSRTLFASVTNLETPQTPTLPSFIF